MDQGQVYQITKVIYFLTTNAILWKFAFHRNNLWELIFSSLRARSGLECLSQLMLTTPDENQEQWKLGRIINTGFQSSMWFCTHPGRAVHIFEESSFRESDWPCRLKFTSELFPCQAASHLQTEQSSRLHYQNTCQMFNGLERKLF